jgi:hypothetical protein
LDEIDLYCEENSVLRANNIRSQNVTGSGLGILLEKTKNYECNQFSICIFTLEQFMPQEKRYEKVNKIVGEKVNL